MFDLSVLGAYFVLATLVTFSLAGLILGIIKRDYVLAGNPRTGNVVRFKGFYAVFFGSLMFLVFGLIAISIIISILQTQNLLWINYVLLLVAIIGPLLLILNVYRKPVNLPK